MDTNNNLPVGNDERPGTVELDRLVEAGVFTGDKLDLLRKKASVFWMGKGRLFDHDPFQRLRCLFGVTVIARFPLVWFYVIRIRCSCAISVPQNVIRFKSARHLYFR